jgi:hypothetical protein
MSFVLPAYLHRDAIALNGTWLFTLDPQDLGIANQWYSHDFDSVIEVPGSWTERGYGDAPTSHYLAGWNALREYEGAVWYARNLDIPVDWEYKSVELILKGVRCHSSIWLDGNHVGEDESLSVPHRYNLTPFLKLGSSQRLTIRIDNRMVYPLDESHLHSEQTATHWGGITGGVELVVSPVPGIKTIQCRPDISQKAFHFEAELNSPADLTLVVTITNPETGETFSNSVPVNGDRGHVSVQLGAGARLWWDDDPFLYQASIAVKKGNLTIDALEKRVGLREIAVQGKQILLNGSPLFLRGYVDCCIFPQTGYPVWDIDHYRRQFRIARSYGFNHVRLHSWMPPEPFWDAADECGMLVQTELPNWTLQYRSSSEEPLEAVHRFLTHELEHIVEALNLHPSWIMLSNGNELIGPDGHPRLLELVARGKELDSTRLYTDNTGFGQLPAPHRSVDFYIQSCNWHPPKKIYDAASNDTTEDFSAITAQTDRPLIGHEHGQFTMYVRPSEAEKYTGVLRPTWLESIRETFEAKGITGRIDDYIHASGVHMVRAYKENIERARRTEGLAGIQLLDIRDFPGQGHATTGILDMFWDSKGLIEPELFTRFNSAVVLLMRAASPTFWNNDPIVVDIEVSNFGHEPIAEDVLHWELQDRNGTYQLTGQASSPVAPIGEITRLTRLKIALPPDGRAHGWELSVRLGAASNRWHVWSFPYPQPEDYSSIGSRITELRNALPNADFTDNYGGTMLRIDGQARDVLSASLQLAISDRLSLRLLQYLSDGGCVWLMPDSQQLYDYVPTRYLPPFWSYLHFPDNVSSVMGMIIPEHPALTGFPHDGVSDWQWYSLVNDSPAICLDSVPFVQPIVEVIDNFNRAKRLCYAFETRIGQGRLFVSTWRLYDRSVAGHPEARFLFHEIVQYLCSPAFDPAQKLSIGQLLGLFKLTNLRATNLD